jgi:ABC-2 type transport system ATP-binding protein
MIETRSMTRRFGGDAAVDRLDLSIAGHGLVGLLGPNGAGKTTTLRLLTGFLGLTDGSAVVCGFDVVDQPLEVRARVGYQPETPPLYPELQVGEYLRFVAEIRGIGRAERLRRVGEVLERTGLVGWERRRIADLSKGYRQRVALAQAIVHAPPLVLLDEPTAGLDPVQLVSIRALIRELAADRLVVFSTHLLPEVEQLCDRVLVLSRGRLVGDGTVAELAALAGLEPWLELGLQPGGPDVSTALAALPGLRSVSPLGNGRYRLQGVSASAVVALAVGAGWEVASLIPCEPTLEGAFLRLVGGEP